MTEDVLGIVGTIQAGKFAIEELVAQTPDGFVYRALHEGFRSSVALRCLKVPVGVDAADLEAFLHRFRQEAEVGFHLSAGIPELVRPLHVDALFLPDDRMVPFIAYEWLDGETLEAYLRTRAVDGRPPTLERLLALLHPVARALARAHQFPSPEGEVAYVHGDLRPESILVTTDAITESVRLLHFGWSRARAIAGGRGQLGPDELPFTPAYAAPEQWRPLRFGQLGPWTDVWGLALTLVEALAGSPPMRGDLQTMMSIALDDRRRPTPQACGVDVGDAVELAFQRALAVYPEKRPRSIEDFWRGLERAAGLEPRPFDDDRRPRLSYGTAVSSIPPSSNAAASPVVPPAPRWVGEAQRGSGGESSRAEVGVEFELDAPARGTGPPRAGTSRGGDATVLGVGPLATPRPPPATPAAATPLPPPPALELDAPLPVPTRVAGSPLEPVRGSPPPIRPLTDAPLELLAPAPFVRHPTPPPSRPRLEIAPIDDRGVWAKMMLPGGLFAAAVVATSIDLLLVRVFGYVLPVSMKWISVPLVVAGAALAVVRFLRGDEGR